MSIFVLDKYSNKYYNDIGQYMNEYIFDWLQLHYSTQIRTCQSKERKGEIF